MSTVPATPHTGGPTVAADGPPVGSSRTPLATRVRATLDRSGELAVAGALAGAVALGAGSRLAMRLVALTSGRIGTGARPESGAVPGEFTLGGTLFLVMAGTIFGAIVAVAVGLLVRRWLPHGQRGRRAALVAGLAFLPALVLVDPANPDFDRFGPAPFAVALFLGCAYGYGLIVAALTTAPWGLRGRWSRGLRLLAGAAALAGAASLGVGGSGTLLVGVPAGLLLLVATVTDPTSVTPRVRRLDQLGGALVVLGAVAASTVVLARVAGILW